MNQTKLLERIFLHEEDKKEPEINLIDEESLATAIGEMKQNLFKHKTRNLLQKIDRSINQKMRKTLDRIQTTETACDNPTLLVAYWVSLQQENNKSLTINSLIRWFDANKDKTKEEIENYLSGRCDIFKILEELPDGF